MRLPLTRMGRLLFLREGSLLAQAFDEKEPATAGRSDPCCRTGREPFLSGMFSVSPSGVLAYRAWSNGTLAFATQLV